MSLQTIMLSLTLGVVTVALGSVQAIAGPLVAAPKCSSSIGEVSRLNLSSLKTGDTVSVCASWLASVVSVYKDADSIKPTKPAKPAPKTLPKTRVSTLPQKRFMSATPDRPVIKTNVYESAQVGQRVLLASTATRHQHVALLLNKPTLLRFTPVSYRWTLGDGVSTPRSQVAHRYKTAATFVVRMSVTYASDVRVLPSSKWMRLPFLVTKTALPVSLKVYSQPPSIRPVAVLVGFSCLEKPDAVGC